MKVSFKCSYHGKLCRAELLTHLKSKKLAHSPDLWLGEKSRLVSFLFSREWCSLNVLIFHNLRPFSPELDQS